MTQAAPGLDFFRCPCCGTTDTPATAPKTVTCAGCGHVFARWEGLPLLVPDWQHHEAQLAQARQVNPAWYLEEQLPEQESPWRHHLRLRRRYVQRAIRRHLRGLGLDRAPRLLDLGCGDGSNLGWLAELARDAYGCDYNLVRLARCKARHPRVGLFLGDLLALPVADDFFDVVFFNHVVEHIPDDVAALAQVRRILRPGGLLVVGAPNEGSWWWQIAYKRDPASRQNTDHVHFYTGPTLEGRLRAAGLTVTARHALGCGIPDWTLDTRLRQHKLVHDLFELAGRLLPEAVHSSLYVLATKEHHASTAS